MASIRALRRFSGSLASPGAAGGLRGLLEEVRDVLVIVLVDGFDNVPIGGDPTVRVDDEAGAVLANRVRLYDIGVVLPAADGDLGTDIGEDAHDAGQDPVDPGGHDLFVTVGCDLAANSKEGDEQREAETQPHDHRGRVPRPLCVTPSSQVPGAR